MAWLLPTTSAEDRHEILGPGAQRVHVIEYGWLEIVQSVRLYAYRLPADAFEPFASPKPSGDPVFYAHVSRTAVAPLGPPERVDDLVVLHATAGIELRLVTSLWPFVDRAADSSVGFSAIRLGNAEPRE